uniref:Uncharacterized protein n=1 Tax=Medicago truncatula TaxID=3880 RepID=I3T8E6_MEDTR|nr:unknown [Medicago truncatula]
MRKDRFSGWECREALQINPFTDFYSA